MENVENKHRSNAPINIKTLSLSIVKHVEYYRNDNPNYKNHVFVNSCFLKKQARDN